MLAEYRSMLDQLECVRRKHAGKDSEEEESLLDKMDAVWLQLSDEEKREANGLDPGIRKERA